MKLSDKYALISAGIFMLGYLMGAFMMYLLIGENN